MAMAAWGGELEGEVCVVFDQLVEYTLMKQERKFSIRYVVKIEYY